MDHDHNFKNLILDYPQQALELFAADEATFIDNDARIVPIRQEQLKERLGERFRELDVPLLVQWPDGRHEALLFVVEEESQAGRFNIHRLAHYSLDLAELFETQRVVPVVIFLRGKGAPRELVLGGDRHTYLIFDYFAYELASLPAEAYRDSDNLVARLNLPNMAYQPEDKLTIFGQALRGLLDLEPDAERQAKYLYLIDIYSELDDNELRAFEQRYAEEVAAMTAFAERYTRQGFRQGFQQGLEQGMQQGAAAILIHQLRVKFGALTERQRERIETADIDTLLTWAERILTASSADEMFD